jgi:hypothetical protein
MPSLERVWRGVLALVIVGTIPLSTWGSGCSSQPFVQPDASGQRRRPGQRGRLGQRGKRRGLGRRRGERAARRIDRSPPAVLFGRRKERRGMPAGRATSQIVRLSDSRSRQSAMRDSWVVRLRLGGSELSKRLWDRRRWARIRGDVRNGRLARNGRLHRPVPISGCSGDMLFACLA